MSIERKCENCFKDFDDSAYCHWCKKNRLVNLMVRDLDTRYENRFSPKEELVRADERNKIITLLKSDLETLDKNSIHYNNFKDYIESTIELLEKEK